ncbi:MAG: WG repeat-containing protein [Chitinophagales bacterium]
MKIKLAQLFFLLISVLFSRAQTDYKMSTKHKDGLVTIYYTKTKPGTSYYSSATSVSIYGLMEEKTKKIILPMKYTSLYFSYEDGLYIVQDSLEKYGLFSTRDNKFIVEPLYNKLEVFSEGLSVVQKKVGSGYSYDYYYGAIDKNGKLVIPDTFSFLGNCRDGLLNFKQNNKYGYLDKQGKVAIPPMYQNSASFANGLAPVQLDGSGKYGYINTENKLVIEPKYVFADGFYEGYATVYAERKYYNMSAGKTNSNKMGLIDTKGNEVIAPVYESISLKKKGGLFVVTKDGKEGLVDSTGKILLPADNKDIGEFYDGIARVEKTSGMYGVINSKGKFLLSPDYTEVSILYPNEGVYAKKDGKYAVYNKDMKVIIPADTARRVLVNKKSIAFIFGDFVKLYDAGGKLKKTIAHDNIDIYGTTFFSDNDSIRIPYFKLISLYTIQKKTGQKLKENEVSDFNEEGIFIGKNTKYRFYDYTGKLLYDRSFENIVNFSEGICGLQESAYSKPYLADKSLNKIVELTTVFYGPYSEGLAMSKSQYGGILYYLDKQGISKFNVYGEDGGVCKNGRIRIKNTSNKYFYVDRNGKEINTSRYDVLGDFYDGLAGFKLNNKYGYIDTSGNTVVQPIYDEASNFSNGVAMVKLNNEYFQIDTKRRALNTAKYTGAADPANGTFPVKNGSGWGLIDNKGNTLVDFKYEEVRPMSENLIWAKKDKKWGLLNAAGNAVTPFDFDGCTDFENGYSKVLKDSKIGIVDKAGKLVVPAVYDNIGKIYKGAAIVVKNNGSSTYAVR